MPASRSLCAFSSLVQVPATDQPSAVASLAISRPLKPRPKMKSRLVILSGLSL